jgi:hypothetical protein
MSAQGCVLELSRKLHVRVRLNAGVQPRRCPSAASLVNGILYTNSYSIFVHVRIVFDHIIYNSGSQTENTCYKAVALVMLKVPPELGW